MEKMRSSAQNLNNHSELFLHHHTLAHSGSAVCMLSTLSRRILKMDVLHQGYS